VGRQHEPDGQFQKWPRSPERDRTAVIAAIPRARTKAASLVADDRVAGDDRTRLLELERDLVTPLG
jgi:hypothetical protein